MGKRRNNIMIIILKSQPNSNKHHAKVVKFVNKIKIIFETQY